MQALATPFQPRSAITVMTLILLEAFAALVILILIVWWTMFSGRKNGELPGQPVEPRDKPDRH